MIYYKGKNELGSFYGVAKNLNDLKKSIKKRYILFKGKTINSCLDFLNAKRITEKEYYNFIESKK